MKTARRIVAALLWLGTVTAGAAHAQQASVEDREVAFHEARVAARPDDADALRLLAAAYQKRAEVTGDAADYDRAWKALDRAEPIEPGDVRTLRSRAAILLSRHRFPHALALAEHGLKAFPENLGLLEIAGDAALEMGALDLAEKHYAALHKLSKRVSDWARMAHLAELRGELDLAAERLNKALEAGTTRPAPPETLAWCHAVLGEVELKRGKRNAARENYQKGLEIRPDHPLALEHLAELEKLEGNLPAAETAYRRTLARRWEAGAAVALAGVLDSQNKKEEAATLRARSLEFYERAVVNGNEGYLRQLADLDFTAGRFDRAAALLARDLALRPNPDGRGLLLRVLEHAAAAGKPIVTALAENR